MPILFSNPLGFWALLGIPAVLLIHFLQRQSQVLPSSTLFLLDAIDRQSLQGKKIDRLRNSIPLWLQLLAVLLLTWLLVEPRWDRESVVQRIVVVIDSSASMQAFQEEAVATLGEEIPPLTTALHELSLTLLESHSEGSPLYRGDSIPDMLDVVRGWTPSNSAHSPEAALRIGRSVAGAEGTLILLTDHEIEVPFGGALLAVGEPIQNVGFAGSRIEKRGEEVAWEVTVINHSDSPQTREWRLSVGEQVTAPRALSIEPDEVRTLSGKFPENGAQIRLLLSPDRFPPDDTLFLLPPSPKPILTAQDVEREVQPLVASLLRSIENAPLFGTVDSPQEIPDLVFATYNPLQPEDLPPQSVVLLHQKSVPREFFSGAIAMENHPLTKHLNWQGLIARKTPSIPAAAGDEVLLWQGDHPLIILRILPDRRQLLFNFDVAQSNAARIPAFVILIHRFVDLLRQDKVAFSSQNFELRQFLDLAVERGEEAPSLQLASSEGTLNISADRHRILRAPSRPGVFSVRQGDTVLLSGTANFADTREADFSNALSRSDLASATAKITESQTVIDPWWSLWLLALLALVLAIWWFLSKPLLSPSETPAKTV
ncbi:MAG: BatA domain-containing protein [Verrucomicrobiota bacterium]